MIYNYMIKIYVILILIAIILILIYAIYRKKTIDSFDNLESNLFTYDTCCSQDEIKKCESYGKTGVCNYFQKNKSCLCQSGF